MHITTKQSAVANHPFPLNIALDAFSIQLLSVGFTCDAPFILIKFRQEE